MSAGGRFIRRSLPPVGVFVLAVAVWAVWARAADAPPWLFPRPAAVLRSFVKDWDKLLPSLGWTALAAMAGFIASAAVGIVIAIVLSASPLMRRAFYPYTLFFQTVPIVAIAPMLIIWLGVGIEPVVVCAFIVSVFPVIANTLAGLLSTDPALADLFRLYGARPIAALWKLRLPSALPNIFTGLRIAAGLAVIGTVVAEFLVGQIVGAVGLGVRVVSAIHESRMDLAFAAVLLASLLGLAMFGAVNVAGHFALRRWHASEQSR
jgi:NitT/TauT family transport system permease protein